MAFNIDDILLENDLSDKITVQIQAVYQTHGQIYPLDYAFSWVLANQVVQRYYGPQGLDAIPVWRENFGWSQFNLVRAQSCFLPTDISNESQRYIVFDAIAVNWRKRHGGSEIQYDLLHAIDFQKQTPLMAINGGLQHLGLEEEKGGDHSACLHSPHSYTYTKLFEVVTDLICLAPEMVAKREFTVDLDDFGKPLARSVHPLRQVGLVEPGVQRDWFQIFYGPTNRSVFVNIFTGDLCYTESNDIPRTMEYPGWNELNEEQLATYLGGILGIPVKKFGL